MNNHQTSRTHAIGGDPVWTVYGVEKFPNSYRRTLQTSIHTLLHDIEVAEKKQKTMTRHEKSCTPGKLSAENLLKNFSHSSFLSMVYKFTRTVSARRSFVFFDGIVEKFQNHLRWVKPIKIKSSQEQEKYHAIRTDKERLSQHDLMSERSATSDQR